MVFNVDSTKATMLAHSKSSVTGKEVFSLELEFPRIVLSEWNTHNAVSKNASSSRAIPVPTMIKQVRDNPAFPARFGKANTGMQDNGTHDAIIRFNASDEDGNQIALGPHDAWVYSANITADLAQAWYDAGYAKQICNRWIETAQMMKVVMTATELNNLFWLRDHGAADPTIAALVRKIKAAVEASWPTVLQPGEWHVPYYNEGYWIPHRTLEVYPEIVVDKFGHSLEHALIISSSCSAQVSYRKLDDTIEKARGVVARLNLQGEEPDQPVHASPLEHQCTPIAEQYDEQYDDLSFGGDDGDGDVNVPQYPSTWQEGITHMDRDGTLCSGNLKGFIQHRQLVPNHVKKG